MLTTSTASSYLYQVSARVAVAAAFQIIILLATRVALAHYQHTKKTHERVSYFMAYIKA